MTFNQTQKLLAGTLALVLAVGMTGQAYAGSPGLLTACSIDPSEVHLQLGPNEVSDTIPKTITCDGIIDDISEDILCQLNTIDLDLGVFNDNEFSFDETVTNNGDISEDHCTVTITVLGIEGQAIVVQELWINEPEERPVAGEFLSVDSSAMVIAGLTGSAAWMIPTVAGLAGAGIYLVKFRANRD